MTEAQPMKLKEMVSDFLVTQDENLRPIIKTKETSEDATKQHQPTNCSLTKPKESKTPSNVDHLPKKHPKNGERQTPEGYSPKTQLIRMTKS